MAVLPVFVVLCTQGLGEVYASVMKQCEEGQYPDVMRLVLEERREAGGSLAPDAHAYASTLACYGKVTVLILLLLIVVQILKVVQIVVLIVVLIPIVVVILIFLLLIVVLTLILVLILVVIDFDHNFVMPNRHVPVVVKLPALLRLPLLRLMLW